MPRKPGQTQQLEVQATSTATPPRRRQSPCQGENADYESEYKQPEKISQKSITVAIFCALPCEGDAIRYSLDEEFVCYPRIVGPNIWSYSFGRIGCHRVLIARPHNMGTVNAADCATTVNQQFPNIMFTLLVGIGAGIPNLPNHDIRLGDAVVSITRDRHPGVVQYHFSEYEEEGFALRGCLNKPPQVLLAADRILQEEDIMQKSPFKKILRGITKHQRFERPKFEDVLFDQSVSHVRQERDCRRCEEKGRKISRELRDEPVVHRGLIISGGGVVKNPRDRDRLKCAHRDALCYEMEAAGISDEIRCLVIRGICEYADTHKQNGREYYAAAVAAAYCKAILSKADNPRFSFPTAK